MRVIQAPSNIVSSIKLLFVVLRNRFDSEMSLRRHERDHLQTLLDLQKLPHSPELSTRHDIRILIDERYREEKLLVMCPQVTEIFSKKHHLKDNFLEIGSGVGWLSALASPHFNQVFSIEPSSTANEIAKMYFGKLGNIQFFNVDVPGFLKRKQIPNIHFFLTCFVLSHLHAKQVKIIADFINIYGTSDSEVLLLERWSPHRLTSKMWNVRTPSEWRKFFPNYTLNFLHNCEQDGTYVGIHLVRA